MKNTNTSYTLLNHTADLGVAVRGVSLIDLFENAGKALLHLMFRIRSNEKADSIKISLSGKDLPDLMVRWLSEILYLFEGEKLAPVTLKIDSISPTKLEATLGTYPFDPKIHGILREIKAVTYHQIEVTEKKGVWEAKVIFDL